MTTENSGENTQGSDEGIFVVQDRKGKLARIRRNTPSSFSQVVPELPTRVAYAATAIFSIGQNRWLKFETVDQPDLKSWLEGFGVSDFRSLPLAVPVHWSKDDEDARQAVVAFKDDASGFYCGVRLVSTGTSRVHSEEPPISNAPKGDAESHPLAKFFEVEAELQNGGEWLDAARAWMQINVNGGDTLTWSSEETIPLAFCKLEDLARVATRAAVVKEREAQDKLKAELETARARIAELEAKAKEEIKVRDYLREHLKIWADSGIPAPENELQSIAAWLRESCDHKGMQIKMRTRMILLMNAAHQLHRCGLQEEVLAGVYDNNPAALMQAIKSEREDYLASLSDDERASESQHARVAQAIADQQNIVSLRTIMQTVAVDTKGHFNPIEVTESFIEIQKSVATKLLTSLRSDTI